MRVIVVAFGVAAALAAGFAFVDGLSISSGHWHYKSSINPLMDKSASAAMLSSTNEAVINGLSKERGHLGLSVINPKTLVVITAPGAAFDCPDVCSVAVRFDNKLAQNFVMTRAPTAPNVLAFQSPEVFVAAIKDVSVMEVELPVTATDQKSVFSYNVAGFDASKFDNRSPS